MMVKWGSEAECGWKEEPLRGRLYRGNGSNDIKFVLLLKAT